MSQQAKCPCCNEITFWGVKKRLFINDSIMIHYVCSKCRYEHDRIYQDYTMDEIVDIYKEADPQNTSFDLGDTHIEFNAFLSGYVYIHGELTLKQLETLYLAYREICEKEKL